MKRLFPAIAFAAFCLLAAPAAQAGQGNIELTSSFSLGDFLGNFLHLLGLGSHHGSNPGGGSGGQSHSAAGPEAGIGVPILLTVGGYVWLVRRNRKIKAKKDRA